LAYRQNFHEEIYSRIDTSKIELRDFLATDRTRLANQSTFLSYLRTALTMLVAGLTLIRFFESTLIAVIGSALLPIALTIFVVGYVRYRRMRLSLSRIIPPRRE
jgi:putative membrane protein